MVQENKLFLLYFQLFDKFVIVTKYLEKNRKEIKDHPTTTKKKRAGVLSL